MQNDLGKLTRHYFRLLAGRDAAEDGPEVDTIRALRGIPKNYRFATYGNTTFLVRDEKPGALGYDKE